MPIDNRMRAAADIIAARRLAQQDQSRLGNVAAFRAGIERNVLDDFGLVWRRMLVEQPQLDALQLADAVEPIKPPKRVDPDAGTRAAARRRVHENRRRARSMPDMDPKVNAAGFRRAREALRQLKPDQS